MERPPIKADSQRLITALGLQPHPEGGYFREVYRSAMTVQVDDGRTRRTALTSIYYLLPAGERSRWHRVRSDEIWHFHGGAPLELIVAPATLEQIGRTTLGPTTAVSQPQQAVPANSWQAARTLGEYSLVGCTVAPSFDFADFVLLRDDPDACAVLRHVEPALAEFL